MLVATMILYRVVCFGRKLLKWDFSRTEGTLLAVGLKMEFEKKGIGWGDGMWRHLGFRTVPQ